MMAALFMLWVVAMILAWYGRKQESIYLSLITLLLTALWLWHHVDANLKINL